MSHGGPTIKLTLRTIDLMIQSNVETPRTIKVIPLPPQGMPYPLSPLGGTPMYRGDTTIKLILRTIDLMLRSNVETPRSINLRNVGSSVASLMIRPIQKGIKKALRPMVSEPDLFCLTTNDR